MSVASNPDDSFESVYQRIRDILKSGRNQALQAINAEMVRAYWQIGREIVEEEQRGQTRADYGARLIEALSRQLTQEFGKGFDRTNLQHMRVFYSAFSIREALLLELSWTHYRILARKATPESRSFYEVECIKANWSTRELERQIASLLYERLALSRDKAGLLQLAEQGNDIFQPSDLIKDPVVLEFTGLPQSSRLLESDLEQALMDRLQDFLMELGRDFLYIKSGNQGFDDVAVDVGKPEVAALVVIRQARMVDAQLVH